MTNNDARSGLEYLSGRRQPLYYWSMVPACVYDDGGGWQNKQFLARESLPYVWDYAVNLTVPADHIVAATGMIQNPNEVSPPNSVSDLSRPRPI